MIMGKIDLIKKSCGFLKTLFLRFSFFLLFIYQGRVNLCCSVNMDCSRNFEFCIGNIGENSLSGLYTCKKAAEIRSALLDMLHVPRCCESCTAQRNYVHDVRYIDIPYDFLLSECNSGKTNKDCQV